MKQPDARKVPGPTPAQCEVLEDLKAQERGGFVGGWAEKTLHKRGWIEPVGSPLDLSTTGGRRFRITPAGIEALPKPRVRTAGEELTKLQNTYGGGLVARDRDRGAA